MNNHLTTATNSQPSTQTSRLMPSSSPTIENPSAWIKDGSSPTEIILATAILISLLMGGIATVIVAMTGLVKTIAPKTVNQSRRQ